MRDVRTARFPLMALTRQNARLAPFWCLVLLLCWGGGASADSSLTVEVHHHPTFGMPQEALVTADDRFVLVSISCTPPTGQQTCDPNMSQAGIQVFQRPDYTNPCFNDMIIDIPDPAGGRPLVSVQGIQFFADPPRQGRTMQRSVGAAVEQNGAEFFRLNDLNRCEIDGIQNVQQPPVEPPPPCGGKDQPNCAPGTFNLAVTPSGRSEYAFVANEYGKVNADPNFNLGQQGTIGVIKVQRDSSGRLRLEPG